jgi:outer membrane protein assembly factor BamB
MRNGTARPTGMLVVCLSLLLAPSVTLAQDWPQWRGPNRDGRVTGFTAPATWPKTLTEKWKVTVGQGDSTPALVGDKLYVFTLQDNQETTLCLQASDGKEVWKDQYAPHTTISGAPSRHGQGTRSSPAVAEGKVVTYGFSGILSCLDAASGKVVWRKEFKEIDKPYPRFYAAVSPIIVNGMCVAYVGSETKGALTAFDLNSGDKKWEWNNEGAGYASPTMMSIDGKKILVAESAKSLIGVDPADGKLLFQAPFVGQGMAYNAASPIVDGSTVICTGHGTTAFKVEKKGDAYAATESWTNKDGTQFNTPVLHDQKLYGVSNRGNFFCMDAQTGKTLWMDKSNRGQFGAIVDAGSVLLAITQKGEMTVIQPNDKEFKALATYKVSDGETYAHPVLAGNRIYIKDKDSLKLYTVEGQTAS